MRQYNPYSYTGNYNPCNRGICDGCPSYDGYEYRNRPYNYGFQPGATFSGFNIEPNFEGHSSWPNFTGFYSQPTTYPWHNRSRWNDDQWSDEPHYSSHKKSGSQRACCKECALGKPCSGGKKEKKITHRRPPHDLRPKPYLSSKKSCSCGH